MRKPIFASIACVVCLLVLGGAAPSKGEVTATKSESAPPEELAEAVASKLAKTCYKVADGDKVICEFWLSETWTSTPGFQSSLTILYPIEPGTLVGAMRLPEGGGSDFRQQPLAGGVYVIRYARQPQDGNHIGTSDTLDFLLLTKAEDDQDAGTVDADTLVDRSSTAAESTHPAMIALRPATEDIENLPAIRHDEAQEWTSVRVAGTSVAGDAKTTLQLEFVVVGHAIE